ncbi:MAG: PfkB family carbohydrate kinase [Chthoniobacteraceae bacterium]
MSLTTPPSIIEIPATDSLAPSEVAAVLDNISTSSVAVLGDFCLDVYWMIQCGAGEPSVETGLVTRPVHSHRYSPGGAGNVVMNLLALEVPKIHVFGVVGDDLFGRELHRLLDYPQVDRSGLIIQPQDWQTHVYAKPHLDGKESNRIDFGDFNQLSDELAELILQKLEAMLPNISVVLINHQVAGSLHNSELFRTKLHALMLRFPAVCFIIDSRGYHEAYPSAVHKLNEAEVLKQSGRNLEPGEIISLNDLVCHALALRTRWNAPLVVTRGPSGCLVVDGEEPKQIFGIQTLGKIDSVGAGDTFVSSLAAIVASGSNLSAAAFVANLAASVTVQKLFQTGTASPAEILELARQGDYVYRRELSVSPHAARYLCGSELEIVEEPSPSLQIRYAIFDHDGTISTLRQGWEQIMEPMMLRSIFGGDYAQLDSGVVQRVTNEVRKFIDKTTGIQTIAQMHGLIEMVGEFGYVPREKILDAAGYKHIFNVELKELVNQRLNKLASRELDIEDFTIKGAVPFLKALARAGMKLYLASGTDDADTKEEAGRLGYADLFTGGIFGSVGDITKDAKKVVIERILAEVGGNYEQLIAFGDGPVEMRETIKRGAYAVGIASDEVRRFGPNLEKRTRLICAGAKAIIPDFSQGSTLWKFLRLPGNPL